MAKIEIEKTSQPQSEKYPRFANLSGGAAVILFIQFEPGYDWHCLSNGSGWHVGDTRSGEWMPSGNILPPGTKLHITVE